jgi:EAL domain-containing protein (putative c-di-GMP-specific phosphodiesterase class I)
MVTGVEALVRWNHRERGAISPAVFIPIAEEANLIWPLGEWVLRKACEDAARWPGEMRVAVNVSPIQFANPDPLPKIVANALAATGLAPDRLELEITESVFLADSAETGRMFKALKGLGVRLALDDFGTGYSSLGYLQSAPFDKIKIDQSFVRDATIPGSRNGAIIAAIVALAEALEMETTAEGIESLDQLDLVRKLNVSHVQGYVYSKAVPQAELLEHAEAGSWTIKPAGPARQRNDRFSLFRKVGAIHDNHRYGVVIRNLSATGAFIEGLLDVPVGTRFVIDFGEGQLVTATVRRSMRHQQGVEFEQDDGQRRQWRAVHAAPRFALSDRSGRAADERARAAVVHDHRRLAGGLTPEPRGR